MAAQETATPGARARVLFLTKYGRRAASTRFRVLQYLPFFEQAGIDADVRPLLGDAYLSEKLDHGRSAPFEVLKGVASRLFQLREVRRYALVVVHMEALPYLPALFEQTLTRLGVPYVYDFDDASFHQYDQHRFALVRPLFGKKIGRIIAGATLVTAGNEYLADYARRFNPKVTIVPTAVDIDQFTPRPNRDARTPVVIGWIGSPSTAVYVRERTDLWQTMTRGGTSVLRLVGAGLMAPGAGHVESRPWREASETDEVRDFDIGIMPLRDDPWSRGKCGFKLIEYLACGVPAVASPVGVNAQIVTDGKTGFLCSTDAEWLERVRALTQDAALRRAMGDRGREVIRQHWSLQRWAPELARLLHGAARATA